MKRSVMMSVLPGIINFKESVNTLHYCRLIYKYLTMVDEQDSEGKNSRSYRVLAEWMFKILSEIAQKVERKEVVYDEETNRKETKLREVTSEYYKKYSATVSRFFESSPDFEQILSETFAKVQDYDSLQLYRPEISHSLDLAYFLIMILEATRLLKRCAAELRFWEWSEYKEI